MEQTNQKSQTEEKAVIENCDAVMWGCWKETANSEAKTVMTFFKSIKKTKNNVTPTEMGYKYNVLIFRKIQEDDIELFTGILGDPAGYVERLGKAGYHGIMYKTGLKPTKAIKNVFKTLLTGYGFKKACVDRVIKETVK